ncbi:oligosaccharide flippase family protein [Ectobacillus funiculus]|uniref:oligosaccharide flippase family protein n=1 Tax=Ectobacillus funiculus TaxID=137993 RepID=UPI00101D3C06|nr:oligosaccharide flippase family protein [Ectobacillus funiculus]
MNTKAITFIKNFSYSLTSQLISMIISTIVILIVPKLIGVEEYGYWQLYLFYASYVGFLHLGWNDGVYLRYGGKEYKELDKDLFFSQFWMLVIFQIIVGMGILVASTAFTSDINKLFIFKMIALCTLIVNVRYMLIYVLQATNKIKEYAQITMMEKVLYCCLILLLLFRTREYNLLIAADIIGKVVSLVYAAYCCRDIVFKKISVFYFDMRETLENISAGIKLMFSNIASILIIGIVRFGIERAWSVSTFGKVSLVISISNLIMIFINAIGIIMFPFLRRTNEEDLPRIYTVSRTFLMVPLLGILIAFYPLKFILSVWLPQYAESLMFMALIFPMCVYEGKMALLINTYLKTLRKEKLMLFINLVSVVLSIIFTILFTIVFKNLTLAIVSIVVLLAFRCAFAEILLSKILNISVYKDILLEIVMSLIFILIGWFVTSLNGALIYLAAYGLYVLIKKRDITITLKEVKQLVKK